MRHWQSSTIRRLLDSSAWSEAYGRISVSADKGPRGGYDRWSSFIHSTERTDVSGLLTVAGNRRGLTIVVIGGTLAALAVAATAVATRCLPFIDETIRLELSSVTVDGEPLADTSAYDAFEVHLTGGPHDGDEVLDFSLTAAYGINTWREHYE